MYLLNLLNLKISNCCKHLLPCINYILKKMFRIEVKLWIDTWEISFEEKNLSLKSTFPILKSFWNCQTLMKSED
jgi:hypothetical protein